MYYDEKIEERIIYQYRGERKCFPLDLKEV